MNFLVSFLVFVACSMGCSFLNASGEGGMAAPSLTDDPFGKFLKGNLVYLDDDGKRIEVPFASFPDPLAGAFDMSVFGEKVSSRLRIYTGFKQGKVGGSVSEIFICPLFLAAKNLQFERMIDQWTSPVGIIHTWGENEVGQVNFDYVVCSRVCTDGRKSIGEMFDNGRRCRKTSEYLEYESIIKRFYIVF